MVRRVRLRARPRRARTEMPVRVRFTPQRLLRQGRKRRTRAWRPWSPSWPTSCASSPAMHSLALVGVAPSAGP